MSYGAGVNVTESVQVVVVNEVGQVDILLSGPARVRRTINGDAWRCTGSSLVGCRPGCRGRSGPTGVVRLDVVDGDAVVGGNEAAKAAGLNCVSVACAVGVLLRGRSGGVPAD